MEQRKSPWKNARKKQNYVKGIAAMILAFYVIAAFLGLYKLAGGFDPDVPLLDRDTFETEASMLVDTEVIGSDIRLLQEIHGVGDTITYRYSVQTTCPSWNYEDRYVTTEPLDWVNSTSSAVETYAANISIRYDGVLYASGQHYQVPLLGISSNDGTLVEMEHTLMDQAYQAYQTDVAAQNEFDLSSLWDISGAIILAVALLAVLIIILTIILRKTDADLTKMAGMETDEETKTLPVQEDPEKTEDKQDPENLL